MKFLFGKVSGWRHHLFIRYDNILSHSNLPQSLSINDWNEISLVVKISEKVVAPYGKLSFCLPNPKQAQTCYRFAGKKAVCNLMKLPSNNPSQADPPP